MIKTYWKYMGTLVECDVTSVKEERCFIKYWCTDTLEFLEQWVDHKDVVFPKYREYGAM